MNIVNEYSNIGNTDIDNGFETLDAQRRGYHEASLTEFDTSTVPQVANGSMVEVAGSLYEAESNESISGSPGDGTVYIKLVPGTGIVTPTWTATAPTFDDAKQGWYSPTGGEENHRYLTYTMTKSGTDYTNKQYDYIDKNGQRILSAEDSTERTITSTTYINETNLSLNIPIKEGEIWVVFVRGEFKSSDGNDGETRLVLSTGSADVYNGQSSKDFTIQSGGFLSAGNTTYIKTVGFGHVVGTSTETITILTEWRHQVGSQTFYRQNAYMYAKRLI